MTKEAKIGQYGRKHYAYRSFREIPVSLHSLHIISFTYLKALHIEIAGVVVIINIVIIAIVIFTIDVIIITLTGPYSSSPVAASFQTYRGTWAASNSCNSLSSRITLDIEQTHHFKTWKF